MRELNESDLNAVFGAGRTGYAELCGGLGTYSVFAGMAIGALFGDSISGAVAYAVLGGVAGGLLGGIILPAAAYGSYTVIRDANVYLGMN